MTITDTHVYFYGGTFSNWHLSENQFKDPNSGLIFHSTEQALMWYKAKFFNDEKIAALISVETHPSKVKNLGREVKNYNDKAWSCVRLGFMIYVNYLKHSQNSHFPRY